MIKLISLFLVFSVLVTAMADEDVNFAYEAELAEGHQSLRQFDVPFSVYEKLQQSHHNDLRVFDADGVEVPSTVGFPRDQLNHKNAVKILHFFIKPELAKSAFNRHTGEETALYSTLFVENKDTEQALHNIEPDWENTNRSTTLSVTVKASDDMSNWHTVSASDYLYDLHQFGERLKNTTITLRQPIKSKYIAIQFKGSENGLAPKITQVKGGYQSYLITAPARHSQAVELLHVDTEENTIRFNIPLSLKVKSIKMKSSSDTGFYKGRLYSGNKYKSTVLSKREKLKQKLKHGSKPNTEAPVYNWHFMQNFSQFSLITETGVLLSEPVYLDKVNNYNYWQVKMMLPKQLSESTKPALSYTWQGAKLTFLAQGKPPFIARFGVNSGLSSRPSLDGLASLSKPELITLKPIKPLVVEAKPEAVNVTSNSNYQWLLWAILVGGLFLMGFIAFRVISSLVKK